jgi:quinol monooxygenase YgiN
MIHLDSTDERRMKMSEPIVFISHFKVKEGKLDGLKGHAQRMVELIQAEKPGTLAFLQYLNEDETELSIVHVFTDADAFDKHNEGVAERAKGAFEFLEPISRELFGMPSEKTLAMMTAVRPPSAPEIEFHHMPQHMGGYIRFKAE